MATMGCVIRMLFSKLRVLVSSHVSLISAKEMSEGAVVAKAEVPGSGQISCEKSKVRNALVVDTFGVICCL